MVKCDPSNLFNVVVFFYIHNGKSMKSGWFCFCAVLIRPWLMGGYGAGT